MIETNIRDTDSHFFPVNICGYASYNLLSSSSALHRTNFTNNVL